ncbi:MAG TPA: hypothetical protein VGQ45_15615 [Gaiellales bacterium]|nr:hypothetical protein [Gaiellales bacterium]
MPPYGLLMGSAMRAARKQADPQMAFIVPAKTQARWWRRACAEGEVRLLDGRVWIPARGRQSIPTAVVIFGRPARVVEWDWQAPAP